MPYQIHKIELMMHMYFSIHSLLYYLHSSLSIKPFFVVSVAVVVRDFEGKIRTRTLTPQLRLKQRKTHFFDAARHKNRTISQIKLKVRT